MHNIMYIKESEIKSIFVDTKTLPTTVEKLITDPLVDYVKLDHIVIKRDF